jgi:hypothetical protein
MFNASDSGDRDTVSPEGQHVIITWPDSACEEGLYGPYCTFTSEEEGIHEIEVVVTDDDNASVSDTFTFEVLNVAPTIGEMSFAINGIPYLPIEGGLFNWTIDEEVLATLSIEGDDTLSDREDLLITWYPDDSDQNWTVTTSGPSSVITASWDKSGLYTVSAFSTDDDGLTSETILGYIKVNNIAPVLEVLPASQAIFEDEVLNLSASAFDFADAEDLRFCWDLVVSVDSDENGIDTDDCDIEGQDLVYSWPTSGLRTITANVWDDDNATDSFSIDVTIVNRPPAANIFVPEGGFVITEGDSITFSGSNSSDTPTDRYNLVFIWDDPTTEGATQDGSGEVYTIEFERPGSYVVNLTVTDDDGKSSTASVMVEVEERQSEGLFGMTSTLALGSILAFIMAALVITLLLRGRDTSTLPVETKMKTDLGWDNSPPAANESAVAPVVEAAVNSGPPIPAAGLPAGWTMEQWAYYGEQYLVDNPHVAVATPAYSEPPPTQAYAQPEAAPVYSQPAPTQTYAEPTSSLLDRTMVQEPAPTPASQELADLLGDLDL